MTLTCDKVSRNVSLEAYRNIYIYHSTTRNPWMMSMHSSPRIPPIDRLNKILTRCKGCFYRTFISMHPRLFEPFRPKASNIAGRYHDPESRTCRLETFR